MSSVGEAQIAENALELGDETNVIGYGHVQLLPSLVDAVGDERAHDLRDRLETAVRYYSHLWGDTVTVGVLEEHEERHRDGGRTAACALIRNRGIHVRTDKRISNSTLFHELAHLEVGKRAAAGHDLPTTSEEFCDIYSLARMPRGLLFDDDSPHYLGKPSVPRDEWPAVCRRALAYRDENGAGSHYIKQCREWLGVER